MNVLLDKFRPAPKPGIVLERDPSLDIAPYRLLFDEERYEYRLRKDLYFDDRAISRLSLKATNKRSVRPFVLGSFNRLTYSIKLKPGTIWRTHGGLEEPASRKIASNLRHESKHAAQSLVDGVPFIHPFQLAKAAGVSVVSTGLAFGEHLLFHPNGYGYSDIGAVATYWIAGRIGMRWMYRTDPIEISAREFQHDDQIARRWAGVIALEAA